MTEYQRNKKAAEVFTQAIKDLASKPENLENLRSYLIRHFPQWLEMWANSPEWIAREMKDFADMEIPASR